MQLADNIKREQLGSPFTWGCATAAYQVEGSVDADGKGRSIWDNFVHRRNMLGRSPIKGGATGDVATDSYRRYRDDIRLVADLGFDAYRFSIAWPRIQPTGASRPNQAGIDHYSRVVDACLEAGVEPWVTLYHWDLPAALERRGGWTNRDIVGWYSDYVAIVVDALSDRVANWMLFNEPVTFTTLGYLAGIHAPGRRGLNSFFSAVHHVNLATAAGAAAARAAARSTISVGSTCYLTPPMGHGPGERAEQARRSLDAILNRMYLEPNLGMGYPWQDAGIIKRVQRFMRDGDVEACKVDLDFLGVQYYTRIQAMWAPIPGVWAVPYFGHNKRVGVTSMGWEIRPDGLGKLLDQVAAYQAFPKIYVTENGGAFDDRLVNGRVHDPDRIDYYARHIDQVRQAQQRGIPVEGYFCWSLLDNFEWAEGFGPRFGLTYVDYATQQRYVKDSGYWFAKLLGGALGQP